MKNKSLVKASGLSSKQFVHLAQKLYHSPHKRPVILYGPPGIGKTDAVKNLAETLFAEKHGGQYKKTVRNLEADSEVITFEQNGDKFYCIIISAPLLEPTDVKGLPVPDLEKKIAYWLEPYFLPKEGSGIILVDDLTAATPAVVSSLLMLVQHRRVLQYKVPEGFMIIAAGNRVQDYSDANQLSAPMRSRFIQINFVPDFNEWVQWAFQTEVHESVIAFMKMHSGTKYFYTTNDELNELAFACPRTWEYASDLVKLALPNEILDEAVKGVVGEPAGHEFMMHRRIYEKLPRIEDILKNPDKAIVPTPPDALHAISVSLAAQAKHDRNFKSIIRYACRLPPEFETALLQHAAQVNYDIIISGSQLSDGTMDYGEYLKEFADKYERILNYTK